MNNSKTVYLIDYENVQENGLAGGEKLTDNDTVCIFTGQNTSVKFSTLAQLNRADLHCFHVKTCKQSVDMCISTYLGHLITKNKDIDTNYVIVSKDNDYKGIIPFWKEQSVSTNITQRAAISE
jgi:hypothetical protein